MRHKGEQRLRYNMKMWNKNGGFDILNDIRKKDNLAQLMYTLGNVNHAISILRSWIFDSNYEKSLCLTRESLDIILSPSVGE